MSVEADEGTGGDQLRVQCVVCGNFILRTTADESGGKCKPCGWGRHREPFVSREDLRARATAGDAGAAVELARRYGSGSEDTELDHVQRHAWRKRAAELGDAGSQKLLGDAYYNGTDGHERDVELAFGWYQCAANAGNSGALFRLIEIHRERGEDEEADRLHARSAQDLARDMQRVEDGLEELRRRRRARG